MQIANRYACFRTVRHLKLIDIAVFDTSRPRIEVFDTDQFMGCSFVQAIFSCSV